MRHKTLSITKFCKKKMKLKLNIWITLYITNCKQCGHLIFVPCLLYSAIDELLRIYFILNNFIKKILFYKILSNFLQDLLYFILLFHLCFLVFCKTCLATLIRNKWTHILITMFDFLNHKIDFTLSHKFKFKFSQQKIIYN